MLPQCSEARWVLAVCLLPSMLHPLVPGRILWYNRKEGRIIIISTSLMGGAVFLNRHSHSPPSGRMHKKKKTPNDSTPKLVTQ